MYVSVLFRYKLNTYQFYYNIIDFVYLSIVIVDDTCV